MLHTWVSLTPIAVRSEFSADLLLLPLVFLSLSLYDVMVTGMVEIIWALGHNSKEVANKTTRVRPPACPYKQHIKRRESKLLGR